MSVHISDTFFSLTLWQRCVLSLMRFRQKSLLVKVWKRLKILVLATNTAEKTSPSSSYLNNLIGQLPATWLLPHTRNICTRPLSCSCSCLGLAKKTSWISLLSTFLCCLFILYYFTWLLSPQKQPEKCPGVSSNILGFISTNAANGSAWGRTC